MEKVKAELESVQAQLERTDLEAKERTIQEKGTFLLVEFVNLGTDALIAELREKLDEAYKDFDLLSLDWDKLDSLLSNKGGNINLESLRSQLSAMNGLKEKVEVYRKKMEGDMKHIESVEREVVEKEREVLELRERIEAYENGTFFKIGLVAGYGMKEAIKDIKDLRLRKALYEREVSGFVKQVNDLESQIGDLVEENGEMRNRLGIKEGTKIDLTNVRHLRTIELVSNFILKEINTHRNNLDR